MIQSHNLSVAQNNNLEISEKFAFLYERRNREIEGLAMVLTHFIRDIEAAKQSFYKMDISDASSYDYSQRINFFLTFVKYRTDIDLDIFLNFKKYLGSRTDYKPSTKAEVKLSGVRIEIPPAALFSTTRSSAIGEAVTAPADAV